LVNSGVEAELVGALHEQVRLLGRIAHGNDHTCAAEIDIAISGLDRPIAAADDKLEEAQKAAADAN
jgi:hypothetical protein